MIISRFPGPTTLLCGLFVTCLPMAETERSTFPASQDAHLLPHLKSRYNAGFTFTSVTPNVLLSMAPPQSSSPTSLASSAAAFAEASASIPLDSLSGLAERAYQGSLQGDSSVIIALTGESGSGKTRNAALLIDFLARPGGTTTERLPSLLAHADTVLKAFGCADVGPMCGHASRYERETIFHFGSDGRVVGASVATFGFEEVRLVSAKRVPTERSFTVLYQLLAGASIPQLRNLRLLTADATSTSAQDYEVTRYIRPSGHWSGAELHDPLLTSLRSPNSYLSLLPRELLIQCVATAGDSVAFARTVTAMEALGITEAERWEVMRVLAAILHLGNVTFRSTESKGSVAVDSAGLHATSRQLGVEDETLLEPAIVSPRIMAGREVVRVSLSKEQAETSRNDLMVNLYARTFAWLVRRINAALGPVEVSKSQRTVSVVDLAGFSASRHSLTQLMFNHATDRLHVALGKRHIVAPQEDFLRRRLAWTWVDPGLDEVVTDALSRRPHGALVVLSEESVFPKATDATYLAKLAMHRSPVVEVDLTRADFAVRHASGRVRYPPTGWTRENLAPLQDGLSGLMKGSTLGLVRELWDRPVLAQEGPARRCYIATRASAFLDRMHDIAASIANSTVYTVHCVLPNRSGLGGEFDASAVEEQLAPLCIGPLLHVHLRGYPFRLASIERKVDSECPDNRGKG